MVSDTYCFSKTEEGNKISRRGKGGRDGRKKKRRKRKRYVKVIRRSKRGILEIRGIIFDF